MYTKKHYWELDGLRGIAAMSVALFHLQPFFGGQSFFGHGYLAVDFFFMLSGFILSYTYGAKLCTSGSFVPYVRDRLIRLYPMLLAGSVIGVAAAVSGNNALSQMSNSILPAAIFNSLGLPAIWLPNPFDLNGPTWSLFFELVASIMFGLAAPMITMRRLVIAVITFGGLLLIIGIAKGSLGVGWTRKALPAGLVRVCASFTAGILLHRLHVRGLLASGAKRWWVAPLLVGSFVALPTKAPCNILYDTTVVFILYPFLILAAAGSQPIHAATAKLSGAISYPFYVIHIPVIAILQAGNLFYGVQKSQTVAILMIVFTACVSWTLLKYYDEPIRRYLKYKIN